jgi:hypothetical protein
MADSRNPEVEKSNAAAGTAAVVVFVAFALLGTDSGRSVFRGLLGRSETAITSDDVRQLELDSTCQSMGERFARQIRQQDEQVGIPLENREFTYRSHYNRVEKRCFVLTEGTMSDPFGGGLIMLRQVWDMAAGVGAASYAEMATPVSGPHETHVYRGKDALTDSPDTRQWFERLMLD